MGGRFFLLGILFCAFFRLSGQIDGVHLMMRLHPVQILSIENSIESGGKSVNAGDQRYITVSSTTGFDVSVHRRVSEFVRTNVINTTKGAVHKHIAVDYDKNVNQKKADNASLNSADLVLTLISQ
ncbi:MULTISPECIES: hypothetical protein [Chryseobacterium]|uniref:Uncharacterized protein n=1 Tax=Chryseobacterium endophyticum TaxID=1854762 RepID=A0AAU6WJ02_9FLAO|nr:hypothetical protein [uncultured Chryseobacterium sp.]